MTTVPRPPMARGIKIVIALLSALIVAVVVGIVVFVSVTHNAEVEAKKSACDAQYPSGSFAWFLCNTQAEG